ncbi:MAG: hydantoinase/oxoprolinase family protein [Chloroflexota bacterium]|nr:MAG: hydantoinase/oxoprolinase family protein [Chloroflexota bacterium]
MKNTVNVDIGGTFTDCYVTHGDRAATSKVPTTRYNLSVGFNQAVVNCARELGVPMDQLLEDTEIIRYATTLAMNALLEHKGPKIGLITTAGFEDTIFIGRGAQWHDAFPPEFKRDIPRSRRPEPLIPRRMVVGVRERIDCFGQVVIPLRREEVRRKLQQLVDKGAMGFVVSLLWSYANPEHEELIREVIEQEYPDVFLGSMPILLSSEVLPKKNEYQRSMTTILDAYLHRAMADELTELGNELRDRGYRRSLYIVHNSGGCATLQQTQAVKTFNAGPVAGLIGAAHVGKACGYNNIIVSDMGGTSFDIGMVVDGSTHFYRDVPLIDWWRVGISMIETKSIGAGGGSIAWIDREQGNRLEVGPRSAGSLPGPACFDRGGEEPTVTDVDVVLGYVDPDYFLGGKLKLNKQKAVRAIRERIADPLGISVEEAAAAIKRIVDGNMGNEVFKETQLKGYDPRDFVLFAYGGGGPSHCCGYGQYVKTPKILTFPQASIFSAYGVSIMDVVHSYEETPPLIRLLDATTQQFSEDYAAFNDTVRELQARALRDLRGLDKDQVVFELDLDMRYGMQPNESRIRSPRLTMNSKEDAQAIYETFVNEYARIYGPSSGYPQGGVEILNLCLWAMVPAAKPELPTYPLEGADPSKALKGTRAAYWDEYRGFRETNVYTRELLRPGNVIQGPAIIEAVDTTIVISPGWTYSVDQFMAGLIETAATAGAGAAAVAGAAESARA